MAVAEGPLWQTDMPTVPTGPALLWHSWPLPGKSKALLFWFW